jgi:LacI family transcriptional regulator
MMPDATIYDVAERAGVSISTVSRVLNSPDQVNISTRSRVLDAIDELNFVPRAEAAARARKGTRRIGVLAPFITYPSFVQRLRGVAMLADSAYELVIYNVESAARRDAYLATLPVTRRLDGLLIMALPFGEVAAQRLLANGMDTVLIECNHPSFSSVEIDDEEGGRMVAAYLIPKQISNRVRRAAGEGAFRASTRPTCARITAASIIETCSTAQKRAAGSRIAPPKSSKIARVVGLSAK